LTKAKGDAVSAHEPLVGFRSFLSHVDEREEGEEDGGRVAAGRRREAKVRFGDGLRSCLLPFSKKQLIETRHT
jgi:hypothetical protein